MRKCDARRLRYGDRVRVRLPDGWWVTGRVVGTPYEYCGRVYVTVHTSEYGTINYDHCDVR